MEKSLSLGSDRLIENFIHRDLTRLSQLQRFIDLHQIHCIRNDQRAAAGIAAGVQVFGLSFAQHMVVSQLSRTGLSNALMAPSQAVVGELGFKASATIVNGLRALMGKTAISGAAASKQLAKMLRGNAVSTAVALAVFSVPETYRLFQGKASGAQYAQNMACLATSIAGGIAGATAAPCP